MQQKQPVQAAVEKIISSYENVYGCPVVEETLLSKCRSAIGCIKKAEKEIGGDYSSGTHLSREHDISYLRLDFILQNPKKQS